MEINRTTPLAQILSPVLLSEINEQVNKHIQNVAYLTSTAIRNFSINYGYVILSSKSYIEINEEIITDIVLGYFNKKKEEIFIETGIKDGQKRKIVQIRQLIMCMMYKYLDLSFAEVGDLCAGKDHATVMHARKQINNLRDTDKNIQKYYSEISQIIETFIKRVAEKKQ